MLRKFLLTGALLGLIPAAALAGSAITSAGPRVGFSVDPDQIVFGGQMSIGEVAPRITFNPNVELGFGSDRSLVALNFDMHYHMKLEDSDWKPYAGAGIGIDFTDRNRTAPLEDESGTSVGGELLLGAGIPTHSGNNFFTELKLGLGSDMPSLRLLAGWNFNL